MFKYVSTLTMLAALGMGVANAQQAQAPPNQDKPLLTKLEIPGADFDIVIATIKPGENIDPGKSSARADQWQTRVYLVPKAELVYSPE